MNFIVGFRLVVTKQLVHQTGDGVPESQQLKVSQQGAQLNTLYVFIILCYSICKQCLASLCPVLHFPLYDQCFAQHLGQNNSERVA